MGGNRYMNIDDKLVCLLNKVVPTNLETLDYDIDLFDSGYLDSFDFLNFMCMVNDEFDISFLPEDFIKNDINTVNKILNVFHEKLEEKV